MEKGGAKQQDKRMQGVYKRVKKTKSPAEWAGPTQNTKQTLPILFLSVTAAELIDTACCIHQLHLTGVKRMRGVGDFQFNEWVLVSVFPYNSIFGICCGFGDEGEVVGHIFEYDQAVIFGMEVLFHFPRMLKGSAKVG